MPRHVAVDFETAQSNDHAIEIGMVEIVDGLLTGRTFARRYRPTVPIHWACAKVHGIKLRDLEGEPSFRDGIDEVLDFIGDAVILAHNRTFEHGVFAKELARFARTPIPIERFACTMRMAKEAGLPGVLRKACPAAGIDVSHLGERHAALEDADLSARLFLRLSAGAAPVQPELALTPVPPSPPTAVPSVVEPVETKPETEAAHAPGDEKPATAAPVPAEPMPTSPVRLRVECLPAFGLAGQRGNLRLVDVLAIENPGDEDLADVTVTVTTDPAVTHPFAMACDRVAARSSLDVPCALLPVPARLEAIEESMPAVLTARLSRDGRPLAEASVPFRVLARDEWPGLSPNPELLAAFVRPNERSVDGLLRSASLRLAAAGRDAAIAGYDAGGRRRSWEIAEAAYLALSDLGLSYALPPASFERRGQKVRGPSAIVGDRVATCLDSTLLYAACIEQAGLRPVLVVTRGHALCGVWLARETFGQCLVDDAAALRARTAAGDLVLVETTLLAGRAPFTEAVLAGSAKVDEPGAFELAIDVAVARAEGVLPLELGEPGAALDVAHPTPEPVQFGPVPHLEDDAAAEAADADRLSAWKRKLLDLSQRNRLLNYKDGKGCVPLLVGTAARLEDLLSASETVNLKARAPTTIPADQPEARARAWDADLDENGAVQADLEATDFERRLQEVERAARTSLAEGGSNTLFVALGFLNWIPAGTKGGKLSHAPLLLVPVSLGGVGAKRRPALRMLQEETRFNPALVELLRQDFAISVGGAALPRDGSGIDVGAVFARVKAAVAAQPGWSVDERRAALTTFSFTKFLMWTDLEERGDFIRESDVARLLLDGMPEAGAGTGAPRERREYQPDSVSPGDLFLPLPADASQVGVVMAAAAGESFVAVGPPGSGKSQTIANIIADSLAHGRTVLFVSQKTAALQAVSRRLDDVGLGGWCLEVHSTKSGRSEVLGRMMETWRSAVGGRPTGHVEAAEQVRAERDRLNAYVAELHGTGDGASPREAIARSVRARLAGTPPALDFSGVGDDHRTWLAAARAACHDLEAMLTEVPDPAGHALADVTATMWSSALRDALPVRSGEILEAAQALRDALDALRVRFGVEAAADRTAVESLARLRGRLRRPEALAGRAYLTGGKGLREALARAATPAAGHDELRRRLKGTYDKGTASLDLADLSTRWKAAAGKWAPGRYLARRPVVAAMAPHAGGSPPTDLGADIEILIGMRKARDAAAAILREGKVPAAFLKDGLPNAAVVERAKAWARDVAGDLTAAAPATARALAAALADADLPPAIEAVEAAYAALAAAEAAVAVPFGAAPLDGADWLGRTMDRAQGWSDAAPGLRTWCAWREAEGTARRLGLGPLVDGALDGSVPANGIASGFEAAYAVWHAGRILDGRPLLSGFVAARHEAAIERFRERDERLMLESRVAVTGILGGRVPAFEDVGGEPQWLGLHTLAAGATKRNAPALRQVFERVPDALRGLAPCMMMSPLSVAQYLPAGTRFDLVIFDEASQVTPWDALGALARGRQVIVVGDPKQLPPTDAMFAADGDGPEGDGPSAESVLDACVAAGMRSRHLRWHYRSRHESLIAFSKAYYYPEMLTFPSPVTRDDAVKVRFVEDGVYDKGARVNQAEARALVAEVVARLTDPDFVARGASLGIVTFNGAQMVLIEEMLLDERRRRPEIDPFFDAARPEHVFVKNLENVQGDERDVILFSVTFSRAADKGPVSVVSNLNKSGGERRLNVAITRARDEMVLFASMRSSDIAPGAATGVAHFKAFLDFAERGPQALAQAIAAEGRTESVLEEEILRGLRDRGWEVHAQVGVSGYRIDLGVVNPLDRGRYLAGVECDGATYHRAASARDRDKLRQAILERLGWRIRRVWSTDWWHDPHGCMERLDRALRGDLDAYEAAMPDEGSDAGYVEPARLIAEVSAPAPVRAAPAPGPVEARIEPAADGPLPPTDPARLADLSYRPVLRRHAEAIIEAEGPVFQDDVVARIAEMHGVRRVTKPTADAILAAIDRRFVRTRDGDRIVRWPGKDHVSPVSPWRAGDADLGYLGVPLPRLAGLAAEIIPAAGEDEARAIRLMADRLGIDRISASARDRLQKAVDLARRHAAEGRAVA